MTSARTAPLSVGSRSGAHSGECGAGPGMPVLWISANFTGLTAPMCSSADGTLPLFQYSAKSSEVILASPDPGRTVTLVILTVVALIGCVVLPGERRLVVALFGRTAFNRLMLDGHPFFLAHGWTPENGFLSCRYDKYCQLACMYLLGIASPTRALAPECWYAWGREPFHYGSFDCYGHTLCGRIVNSS